MDDYDLDDAALWAVIDSAAAASRCRFRSPALLPKPPSPFPSSAIPPPRNPVPLRRPPPDEDHRGEVLQPARPYKVPRLAAHASPPSPYTSPEAGRAVVVVESPSPDSWKVDVKGKESASYGLPGQFPSVATFKQYQQMAMAILEKSDYTMISGNPYIKKSGWRKISCFFNISFEIKDKSIEFDENRNVHRAEFVVRAHIQSGRFSDGWGSCDRREKRFNKPNHDIPSTAETRAKNKACQDLLGIGHNRPG